MDRLGRTRAGPLEDILVERRTDRAIKVGFRENRNQREHPDVLMCQTNAVHR